MSGAMRERPWATSGEDATSTTVDPMDERSFPARPSGPGRKASRAANDGSGSVPPGHPPARRFRWPVLAGLVLLLAGCATATSPSPGPSTGVTGAGSSAALGSPTPTGSPGPPLAVPAHGAYLGAWVHPVTAGKSRRSFAVEAAHLPALTAQLGHPLALVHVFSSFKLPAPVAAVENLERQGSTPVVDWGCGGDLHAIVSGAEDRAITAYLGALTNTHHPLLLRWCWEMNIAASHPQITSPREFVAAWRHLAGDLHKSRATNVSLVWCPALTGRNPAPYFPGRAYVDWIGIDGYDRSGTATFTSLFAGFARQWGSLGKPLMVAETGAQAASQVSYLQSIGTGAPALPQYRAVMYFDAKGPEGNWILTEGGLAALRHLANGPWFQPT